MAQAFRHFNKVECYLLINWLNEGYWIMFNCLWLDISKFF